MTRQTVRVWAMGMALFTSCTTPLPGMPAGHSPATPVSSWGVLPTPLFSADYGSIPSWSSAHVPGLSADPAILTWVGKLDLSITAAPVFRYSDPTFAQANQFAHTLHAGAESDTHPNSRSWSYGNNAEDFRVVVIKAEDARGSGPSYLIFPASDTPVEPASAGPLDRATKFLAGHRLMPDWPYSVATQSGQTQSAAFFERELEVPGYGLTYLVDGNGSPEGLAVSFDGDRMLEVAGMFPMSLQARQYGILSAGAAYDREYGKPRPTPPGSPIVALTHAELDYVVVRAGDYGFYEPVYLYSGTFRINGTDYVKQVLAPALAPV